MGRSFNLGHSENADGAFYEVGRALMEIRDKELYKLKNGGEYGTFEAYCKEVWDMGRRNVYYLIDASMVIENVNHGSQIQTPTNERQLRPLSKLEPDQQREAWAKAVETAPEGKGVWDMGRGSAYHLISASKVRDNLSTTADIQPSTESQLRLSPN